MRRGIGAELGTGAIPMPTGWVIIPTRAGPSSRARGGVSAFRRWRLGEVALEIGDAAGGSGPLSGGGSGLVRGSALCVAELAAELGPLGLLALVIGEAVFPGVGGADGFGGDDVSVSHHGFSLVAAEGWRGQPR